MLCVSQCPSGVPNGAYRNLCHQSRQFVSPWNHRYCLVLSLNCCILDDKRNMVFTVKIPRTDNVSILKDEIKKKNPHLLNDVNAKDLDLFRVSLPVNDKLEESARAKPLNPLDRLSNLFDVIEDTHFQIVVHTPTHGGPISS